MELYEEWSDFKTLVQNKNLVVQYKDDGKFYKIFADEGNIIYRCDIYKEAPASADQTDFETNFQSTANQALIPKDEDNKPYSRAESRPLDMTTYFTSTGDKTSAPQDIGNGPGFIWDFSNTDNDITPPAGYKCKQIEFQFIDGVRIKEGSIYWKGKLFGSYIDLYVVCPDGEVYLDNNGSPQVASGDTVVDHFVNHHFMLGDCYMGDELNTEAASAEIPNNYKFWLKITVPDTDSTSQGHVSIELYRRRTAIL